ncbi:hypothetical protein B0H10DRAFT_2230919 [Mycena sp. CBHHK59/15]|nr:hypothetical protein B0H10DRAFT_2230919 [Mycena sp. CBHHK59/15]
MAPKIDVDMSSCPAFDPKLWIGVGKTYPSDPPWEVISAKNAVLELPAHAAYLIPPRDTPVARFLERKLHKQSSELALGETHLWFSKDAPKPNGWGLLEDITRGIPPRSVLDLLRRKFPQAWLDGCQSISDPRFNDGADRLPLWTLTFWEKMAEVAKHQALWKRSAAWLDTEGAKRNGDEETKKSVEAARAVMKTMGWNTPLTCLRGTRSTVDLAAFLSTVWLNSDHIDMMMEDLTARVKADPDLATKVIVAPLAFSETLEGLSGKNIKYTRANASLLHLYETKIKTEGQTTLYFPAHIGGSHWISGNIDFTTKIIGFGDSLPGYFPPPRRLIRSMQRWLRKQFGAEFTAQYDAMEHGKQKDGFSCGIVSDNTLEIAIFKAPVWIPRRAVIARINKFLKFSEHQKEDPPEKPVPPLDTSTEDKKFDAFPALSIAAGMQDHNFENMRAFALGVIAEHLTEPGPIHHPARALADLLNPQTQPGAQSTGSLSSGTTSGSTDWSDAEVLLGRADWASEAEETDDEEEEGGDSDEDEDDDDDDGDEGGDAVETDGLSEHYTDMMFDGSSGMEMDEGLNDGDIDTPAADVPAPDVPALEKGKTEAVGARSKKQSSLLGFFNIRPGSKRSIASSEKPVEKQPTKLSAKRPRAPSKSDAASSKKQKPNVEQPANVGISRSARAVRAVMDAVRHGSFVVNEVKQEAWKAYIRITDPRAEFFDDNIRKVRHSACGKSFLVKNPYDQNRWDNHINKACPAKHSKKHPLKPSAGASTLPKIASVSGWKKKGATVEPQHVPVDDKPCPGITPKDAPNLRKYLHRTGAPGGGARSVMKIAMAKFGKVFSVLNKRDKKEVLDTQYHEHAWRNDHANLRVFSTKCRTTVRASHPRTLPCKSCSAVLSKKAFKKALKKDAPAPENYIYVNKKYRNKALGDLYARTIGLQDIIEASDAKNTPCIRYAQGALEGKYNDQVFSGLVEAMETKIDREERGVGMQNFDHAPAWDEVCNMVRINSPAAYRALQEHLPGRSERSFRAKEARKPRFPMDITDRNFKLVAEHLAALDYNGPVNLSCDDTKLFPSFRLYWDAEKKAHFLLGGSEGPLRVADPESVKQTIEDARAKKATKIRLWALTIPVPGVAPIIVAALPIANLIFRILGEQLEASGG